MNNRLVISKLNLSLSFKKLLYFLIGFIALSRLSYYLIVIRLGLPFYLPELLLVPLLIIHQKNIIKYFKKILNNFSFVLSFYMCFFVNIILIAIAIFSTGQVINVLSIGRNVIYICLFTYLFSSLEKISYDFIFYISFGAVVGELINAIYYLQLYNIQPNNWKHVAGTNIFAVFLFVSLPITCRKPLIIQLITVLLSGILIFKSAYRIILVTVIISFIFSHLFVMIRSRKFFIKKIISLIIIIIIVVCFFNFYINNYDIGNKTRFRIFNRTMNLFRGNIEASQDITRWNKFTWTWEKIGNKVFPQGFIRAEGSWDVPIVYLYTVFGSMLTWLIFLTIIFKGIKSLVYDIRFPYSNVELSISISVVLVGLLFFVNGRFIHITYESWLFGIILGRWFSKGSYSKYVQEQI